MEEQKLTRKEKLKAFFKKPRFSIKWITIIVIGVVISGTAVLFFIGGGTVEDNCNVTGINLHGTLMTYIPEHADGDTNFDYNTVASESILYSIKQANENDAIKAIVIEVDSGGGSLVGGEEISSAIKNSTKPIVALIRERGASSSYWAISSANRIFASKNSDVGAIGVTGSYLTNVDKNSKDGYKLEILNSGKFKDSGSANKTLTSEERVLFQRDINIIYKNFMEAISVNRNIPLKEVQKFADGSTVLGEKAKELGLIDEIGGINEVEKYLGEQLSESPSICWE